MINILMIEDDPDFSLFLGEYLEKYNIKITNYEDPYLGLSAGISKYDLLILDLTLPGMDGLDVCKEVSSKYDIPIIISSARSDVTDKIMGLQIGADYYLPKSYDPKEMYVVIQSLLRRTNKEEKKEKKKTSSLFEYDSSSFQIFFDESELNLNTSRI
jgi:two-component system OmpR family response regulator